MEVVSSGSVVPSGISHRANGVEMQKQNITVKLETVTPLFSGGADPRGQPELRPPAFRGAMRYWLRATLGGVIGDNDLDNLHKLETKVFGSTDTGSPISIRLQGNLPASMTDILPHKPGSGRRNAYQESKNMLLTISALRPLDAIVWQNACMALNLAILFGGVGLRSRRGYGSLRVIETSDPGMIPVTPTTLKEWPRHIKIICLSAIKHANEFALQNKISPKSLPTGRTRFPCASTESIVRIPDNPIASQPNELLRLLMSKMPQKQFLGGIKPRHSSPLWVRAIKVDGQYSLLMCVLPNFKKDDDLAEMKNFLNESFPGKDIPIKGWNQ
jgi:CRISPR-associated protein Cmr1